MSNTAFAFMWLVIAILFLILEAATAQIVSIWFVVGCIPTIFVAWLGTELWVQLVVFIISSVISLLLMRPIVQKRLHIVYTPTNADMVIGMSGITIEPVNNLEGTGRVFANGLDWSAVTKSNDISIPKDQTVTVLAIDGVKLVVEPQKTKESSL